MDFGILYIVATPIGNYRDITLRAVDILREADAVVCEERRQGSTLLKKLDIPRKELLELNEHNEAEQTPLLLSKLQSGLSLALISDCGTPAFADPGTMLISQALESGIRVVPIPGPSSLMAALSISPLPLTDFIFAGFIPRKDKERRSKLQYLRTLKVPVVLMDTPYRLQRLLEDVKVVFGKQCRITLALNLTISDERIYHGSVHEVIQRMKQRKGEFVLIVHR
ncbi:MAG TPA: 16S rRNA (cytidine(1402)-2'-O)-methyltransferase [Anaerolineae bacterium]|nr:16S rRNA (cytidine(1402)-2'-O)-methyltransferase [Anaerolineae bacterium]